MKETQITGREAWSALSWPTKHASAIVQRPPLSLVTSHRQRTGCIAFRLISNSLLCPKVAEWFFQALSGWLVALVDEVKFAPPVRKNACLKGWAPLNARATTCCNLLPRPLRCATPQPSCHPPTFFSHVIQDFRVSAPISANKLKEVVDVT